jgi:hypothetical protein
LGLRESLRKNVTVSYFEAGHMMYIHQPSLARMAKEIKAFVTAAVTRSAAAAASVWPVLRRWARRARRGTILRRGSWPRAPAPRSHGPHKEMTHDFLYHNATGARIFSLALGSPPRLFQPGRALAQGADDLYEISSRMEMPGMALSVPAQVVKLCVAKNGKGRRVHPAEV